MGLLSIPPSALGESFREIRQRVGVTDLANFESVVSSNWDNIQL